MPFYKLVFNYSTPQKGWSEIFYREASNIQTAARFTDRLLVTMSSLRAAIVSLDSCRVSDVANNRNTLIVPFEAGGSQGAAVDVGGTSAILVLNDPTNGANRHLWMRGLADEQINKDINTGQDTPAPILAANITNYIRGISGAGFSIRSLGKLGTPPNVYKNVKSITTVKNTGVVTVEMEAGFFLPSDGMLIFSQMNPKDWPGLKGVFKGTRVTDSSFTIPYNWHVDGVFPVAKGRVRPANYVYGPINSGTSGFLRFGTRDTGRGPSLGRGRRTGQRIRLA
jgi:hypothetical protein